MAVCTVHIGGTTIGKRAQKMTSKQTPFIFPDIQVVDAEVTYTRKVAQVRLLQDGSTEPVTVSVSIDSVDGAELDWEDGEPAWYGERYGNDENDYFELVNALITIAFPPSGANS